MKKLISILLIVVMVFASGCGGSGAPGESLDELLALGQKYLLEENYEEAIVAFEKAIKIDEKCVDAYLGMADAYIGLDDIDSAKEILQKGYDETEDQRLKEKLNSMMPEDTQNINLGHLSDRFVGQILVQNERFEWINIDEYNCQISFDFALNGVEESIKSGISFLEDYGGRTLTEEECLQYCRLVAYDERNDFDHLKEAVAMSRCELEFVVPDEYSGRDLTVCVALSNESGVIGYSTFLVPVPAQ